MESLEIKELLNMNYDELVEHLLKKHGRSQYDYFVNQMCRTNNKKVSRSKEGLYCHHIDEDKAIKLSDPNKAILSPFEYQKADRLVYCNILEHLILHIKIFEKTLNDNDVFGFSGALINIVPRINDYYDNVLIEKEWEKKALEIIKENFNDYIDVLKFFLELANNDSIAKLLINSKSLSLRTDKTVVKKIFLELSKFNNELY